MTPPRPLVTITSDALSAEIDPLGAQLYTLKDLDGRDLLWNGDPTFWTGRAPILFPIVGMLADGRYRLGDKTYVMGKHGFARHKLFETVEQTPSGVTFRLSADDETLKIYPFAFELDLAFALAGPTLALTATVKTLGDQPMPASFGFHPALRRPLPYHQARSDHRLQFDRDEPAPIRRINGDGVVKPESYPTPVTGSELILRDSLFEADAIIFDNLASDRLRYGAANGPQLEIAFPNTPYLGVWTKPGADFICVEPWHGIADPENFQGDFRDKPGVFEVAPGEARTITMSITLKD